MHHLKGLLTYISITLFIMVAHGNWKRRRLGSKVYHAILPVLDNELVEMPTELLRIHASAMSSIELSGREPKSCGDSYRYLLA